MAQNTHAVLHGSHVQLSGKSGPFRACPRDGSESGTVHMVDGSQHNAQVICNECQMHVSWLSISHLDAMLAQRRAVV